MVSISFFDTMFSVTERGIFGENDQMIPPKQTLTNNFETFPDRSLSSDRSHARKKDVIVPS